MVNFGNDAVNFCSRQYKPRCKVARIEGPSSKHLPRPRPGIQTRSPGCQFNILKLTLDHPQVNTMWSTLDTMRSTFSIGSTNRGVKSLEEKVSHRDVGRVRDAHPVAPKLAVRERRCRDLPRKYENIQRFSSKSGSLNGRFVRRKL